MEENKNVSKNNWKRIFRKKWFFPALYLAVAALLISGVLWYQNAANQVPELADEMKNQLEENQSGPDMNKDEDAEPVMQQQEVLQMPVAEDLQVEIVTKFYDYGADESTQEQGLILHQNRYQQSDGIAISTADQQAFDVMAALSGKVTEIKSDPLLGNVIKMEHEEGVTTYYASIGEVLTEQGAELKQGQTIGTAGQNSLGQDNGVHVHFEVRKDGVPVNPESFINKPINEIIAPAPEASEESEEDEGSATEEEDDTTDEAESDSESDETEEEDDSATEENTPSSSNSMGNA
ncbi:stage II sporulation protein Q [Gracilibacillus ureilyticus]|uniref:Stage II sporulation protein Q n=1 Tax=Gracilibacillus ureilyticus TaxID=531814 RepID=A0A1H9UN99_9BACI|nr:M23 family metallopeptidase [Gracilibacillus ureilyticus]SES10842.1 stage II sporulation protein Q [Gracilibacillus ureilyticus]